MWCCMCLLSRSLFSKCGCVPNMMRILLCVMWCCMCSLSKWCNRWCNVCCVQLEDLKGASVEWVEFLLHRHQPLLLELVRGGGGGGGRKGGRGEEAFLWPFLDLSLTSPGEFNCDFRKQKVTKWTVLEKQNKQKLKQKRKTRLELTNFKHGVRYDWGSNRLSV